MPQVGFKPMIPVFKQAKTVHDLDWAATVIGIIYYYYFLLLILTANRFLPGGSGTILKHKTNITHIIQNNTSRWNKTQHTKLHKQ
jgi:hypothetical protein